MKRTFFWIVILLSVGTNVHAYADPGSGALLWQLGAAAIFGALFQIRRLIAWLVRRRTKAHDSNLPEAEE